MATPNCLAVAHADGDGKRDLVVATSTLLNVVFGNGDGTFGSNLTFATGTLPDHVRLAYINGDAILDAVTANRSANTVSVLLGNGNGTFAAKTDFATGTGPNCVVTGAVNADGMTDLMVANSSASSTAAVSTLNGDGLGGFSPQVTHAMGVAQAGVLTDFDHDGILDMATANLSSTASIRLGLGSGAFGPKADFATGSGSTWIESGLIDNDANPDLVVANGSVDNVSVLFGDGAGGFPAKVDVTAGDTPNCVTIGDLAGTGVPYLIFTNQFSHTVSYARSNGDRTFLAKTDLPVGNTPYSVAVGDLDGNGLPDLAVACYGASSVTIYRRNAAGGFGPRIDYKLGGSPTSIAIGDVNGDGRPDLVASRIGNLIEVLLNRGATSPLAVPMRRPIGAGALTVTPNPARSAFTVSFAASAAGPADLDVIDVSGRRVARRQVHVNAGTQTIRLDETRNLAVGLYLVRVTQGGRLFTARVTVLR
jgi:hypothetical protein